MNYQRFWTTVMYASIFLVVVCVIIIIKMMRGKK